MFHGKLQDCIKKSNSPDRKIFGELLPYKDGCNCFINKNKKMTEQVKFSNQVCQYSNKSQQLEEKSLPQLFSMYQMKPQT